ncbi:MAG: lipoprotein releasing system, transrane protein, LolC/E family, partial [Acidobacteria bacterium]|nr:lipoprotein releasing system, transrane protein, LolC/E family [Acidobacteriota bacterium]
RKQRHTAFLSVISMLGLAIGVFALLFSVALLGGLQGQIKGRLMASSPQLLIEPIGKNTIDDAAAIVAEAKRRGMTAVTPLVSGIGWGANEAEKRGRPARIQSFPNAGPHARPNAAPDETNEGTIVLTRGYAAALGLTTGDEVTIFAPRTRLTPFGPVPVWRRYRVARLVNPESSEPNTADALLNDAEASRLLGTGGAPTSIEMRGSETVAEEIQPLLAKRFPGVQVKTWKEINRPLVLALRLEKIVMFASIALIIFVAALNLISSLSMLIMEKRPQVGVLRTLGATEKNILSIFLQSGLFIGITGTIVGNVFGLGIPWLANRYHWVSLPPGLYFVDYLPFHLDASDIIGVNVIAVLLSVIATWYPARIASRLDPIAAIREE